MGMWTDFLSLGKNINKIGRGDTPDDTQGIVSELLPELELSMNDEELISLANHWLKEWEPYSKKVGEIQKKNEEAWLGKEFKASDPDEQIADNLIFETLETFLPIATRPKADPVVDSDNSDAGKVLSDRVRKMLIYLTDIISYNLKLKQVARYWALYLLGAMKVGWSAKNNEISCVAVRPQKLILDPSATIEDGEYTGYYIGEYVSDMASDLITRFPKKKAFIEDLVKGKTGTNLQYIQWWTDEYMFWSLNKEVLAKSKNPHWNYETEQQAPMDEFGNIPADPVTGLPMKTKIAGKNHFSIPKKPYVFLSIFNLGKQPHDETNLIQQNLPLQNLINKRLKQIDTNADNANNGLAVSGDAFTEEQAKKVTKARRKGGAFWVPTGKISDSILDLPGQPLPQFIYNSLIDYRNELRNIFGTRGSTPQGTMNEQTVRGKMLIRGADTDRIGGGISVYLEQFSDNVFNWFVQLMYVYYDEPHTASVLGRERANEYISLVKGDFTAKLLVGVKEGSMIPTDPVNKRNEAIDLWTAQGIDPITFFDRLEFPNPREAAKQLYLWRVDPVQLFPELAQQQAQAMMMAQQQQQQQAVQQQKVGVEEKQKERDSKMQEISLKGLVSGLVQKAKPVKA